MNAVVFITPGDAEPGFGLAGVDHLTADEATIGEAVKRTVGDAAARLVIIDERLSRAVPESMLREIEKKWQGVVLTLPSPAHAEEAEEDYAAQLIRRAIGYHVRLGP